MARSTLHLLAAALLPAAVEASGSAFEGSRMQANVDTEFQRLGVVGGIVRVQQGEQIWDHSWGVTELGGSETPTVDHPFQVGSITKQFTAAALLRLVERGLVDLDAHLGAYLPALPPQVESVTVRQLPTHTSGIVEFFTLPGMSELETAPPEEAGRDKLVSLILNAPPTFPPGDRWSYSNSNYTLLGLLIERMTGRSLAEVLDIEFFRPLEMARTEAGERLKTPLSPGHVRRSDGAKPAPALNMNTAIGDGSVCSSAADLTRWLRRLGRAEVLSPRSLDRMTAPEAVRRHRPAAYGMGLSLLPLQGHRRWAHGGRTLGYTAAVAYYPDDDLTVVVLTNTGGLDLEPLERALARQVLHLPDPELPAITLTEEEANTWVGQYDLGVFEFAVSYEDGQLRVRMPPPGLSGALRYHGKGRFSAADAPESLTLAFADPLKHAGDVCVELGGFEWFGFRVP